MRYRKIVVLLVLLMSFTPFFVFATGPIIKNPSQSNSIAIPNPLGQNGPSDLYQFIKTFINTVVVPLGGVLVVIAIIYTGFMFVTAQGNSAKLEKAKTGLLYVVIGSAIVLGAWVIAQAISGTVDNLRSGTTSSYYETTNLS